MPRPGRESGLTLFALVLILFLVVFFGTLVVKLSGPYWDQFTLDSTLTTMAEDMGGTDFLDSEFEERLRRNLNINNIDLDAEEIIRIDRRSSNPRVILDYEKRIALFGNVDVVLSFHEEYGL